MQVGARRVQVNQFRLRVGGRGPSWQYRLMHVPSASVRTSLEADVDLEVLPRLTRNRQGDWER